MPVLDWFHNTYKSWMPDFSSPVVAVALAKPLHGLFDYLPNDNGVPKVGTRVRVPFGRQKLIGVVLELREESEFPREKLRCIQDVLDELPLLGDIDLRFLKWVATYYHAPIGEVVSLALPLRLRKKDQQLLVTEKTWRLASDGRSVDIASLASKAPKQKALMELLSVQQGLCTDAYLRSVVDGASTVLKRLEGKQWVDSFEQEAKEAPLNPQEFTKRLTKEQQAALVKLEANLGGFSVALLEGVTGSGKTEVYLRLASKALAAGKSVMVLVPEISLTPQLQARFTEALGTEVVLMHSGLAEGARELAWHRVRLGLTRVAVGTRSLVFNPVKDLGLIIVDEEHDASYKQQDGCRYSARDLAIVRAQLSDCSIVLGSATPSLETLRNAQSGRYLHLHMRERAGGASLPHLQLIDISNQPLRHGLSEPLYRAIRDTLERNEQVIVFLNRRGYAPVYSCYSCGWMSDCHRCDAKQTMHRASNLLWCHHCGAQRPMPQVCPECGSDDLHPMGHGTERLEDHLKEMFDNVPILRIDRDATARKGSLQKLLDQVHEADSALLVGTQMLAKGHHFPQVTLVGVVDIDGGLFSADFRAPERMAQLLLQVAGRAGRGNKAGRVLIQTRHSEHELMQTLVRQGYDAFAQAALQERQAACFPPYTYQALLRAEATREQHPEQFLLDVAAWVKDNNKNVEVWGPVPAPMSRRAGKYRGHLLLQAESRELLQPLLSQLDHVIPQFESVKRVRWGLDVDPLDMY